MEKRSGKMRAKHSGPQWVMCETRREAARIEDFGGGAARKDEKGKRVGGTQLSKDTAGSSATQASLHFPLPEP